jgi:hypothetical protein
MMFICAQSMLHTSQASSGTFCALTYAILSAEPEFGDAYNIPSLSLDQV